MSWYGLAMSRESPLTACEHGITDHPLYHQCDICPDYHACPAPYLPREENKPEPPAECRYLNCKDCEKYYFGCKYAPLFFYEPKPQKPRSKFLDRLEKILLALLPRV